MGTLKRPGIAGLCRAVVADRLLFKASRRFSLSEQLKGRILVVDDDDAIRTMVERVLRRERYDVDSARDGFEAIEKLSRQDYGTVLLDLMMPRVDGHGVLQFLETAAPTPPRVIVMTANVQHAGETARRSPFSGCSPSRLTSAS
jgi:CheY-like chemotaxis protein